MQRQLVFLVVAWIFAMPNTSQSDLESGSSKPGLDSKHHTVYCTRASNFGISAACIIEGKRKLPSYSR